MMVSTKGRYALRIMVDLAENQEGGPVSLKDIAERENIGIKYLEKVFAVKTADICLIVSRQITRFLQF